MIVAFFALVTVACAALAQTVEDSPLSSRIDDLIQPYVDVAMFDGVVLVAHGNEIEFVRAYGMANYETNSPTQIDTKYHIASLSKAITDAAFAALTREGRLSLGTRVSELIPGFPRGDDITIRHLVTHTSGIPHTNALDEYEPGVRTHLTLAQSVEILSSKPLDFEPGSRVAYSNGGYDVLAAMIEAAANMPFQAVVRSRVLEPLGMHDTGFAGSYEVISGLATGYSAGEVPGSRARSRFYSPELRPGGGAMYSTAQDLLRFIDAAVNGRLADAELTRLLFRGEDEVLQFVGRHPGYSAIALAEPGRGIVVITLANNSAQIPNLNQMVRNAVIGEPTDRESFAIVPRRLRANDAAYYDGFYNWEGRTRNPFHVTVNEDGALILDNPASDYRVALVPLSDNRWMHPVVEGVCEVEGSARAEAFVCRAPSSPSNVFRIVRQD